MQESIYVIKKRVGEDLLLFNTRNKKIIRIKENSYYEQLEESQDNELYQMGFLVENGRNEFKDFLLDYKMAVYKTKYMTITYLVTNKCNFRCVYCYEGEEMKCKDEYRMSVGEFEKIYKELLKKSKANVIDFNFFGGEPLLDIQHIIDIMKILNSVENIEVVANIVTNGYLLNKENIKILKRAGINSFQITIDGMEEVHNKYRKMLSGEGTYFTIMNNIMGALEEKVEIVLNINYCYENFESILKLLESLSDTIKEKIYIKFNHLQNTINNQYLATVERNEFTENNLLKILLKTMKEKGYPDWDYEFLESGPCTAQLKNSIIIESDGTISKCIYGIGNDSFVIGNVLYDLNDINKALKGTDVSFLWKDKECKKCKYLPLCKGGCKRKKKEENIDSEMRFCEKKKYEFLVDAILEYYS